jgi:hypothetical protein
MIKKTVGIAALLALIVLGVSYTYAEPPLPNNPRPLVGASMDEVEKYAIGWAKAELRVTGEPTVVLVRDVKLDELPELGLTRIGGEAERSYVLVVLKGDFDLYRTLPGTDKGPTKWHSRVGYVAYVFDRQEGARWLIETSPYGGEFRTLLGDPTLPLAAPPGEETTE